jgi:predicted lipid carrier protein YhbT
MSAGRYVVPDPVGNLLSLLPEYPGSIIVSAGLNLALAKHLPQDVRQALEGKKFRIKVTDAKLTFVYQWRDDGFAPLHLHAHADLTISASAHDFLLLAQRKEDPDTLFFSRRLVMDGDTELGLLVKNTMDAIDGPLFDVKTLAPAQIFNTLKEAAKKTIGKKPARKHS